MKRRKKNICGPRIKNARLQKGLTQAELSRRLGKSCPIDRAGIAKVELGMRRVFDFEAVRLTKVLEIDLSWMLTGKRT